AGIYSSLLAPNGSTPPPPHRPCLSPDARRPATHRASRAWSCVWIWTANVTKPTFTTTSRSRLVPAAVAVLSWIVRAVAAVEIYLPRHRSRLLFASFET
ncbi:hypothetical protein BDZ91DRAFT_782575, partial [Kalaharituber pfeilii]